MISALVDFLTGVGVMLAATLTLVVACLPTAIAEWISDRKHAGKMNSSLVSRNSTRN